MAEDLNDFHFGYAGIICGLITNGVLIEAEMNDGRKLGNCYRDRGSKVRKCGLARDLKSVEHRGTYFNYQATVSVFSSI